MSKSMNLFVDSNIYLNFYHFSSDDLDELKKLSQLIESKEITLFVTKQVINEVKRNRDAKVADAYRKFKDSQLDFSLPQICKTYPEYETIKKSLSILKKAKSDLVGKLSEDISKKTLQADEVIADLFKLAKMVDSDKFIDEAQQRYNFGNPPGKNKSYGDAVNWEALLDAVKDKEDLFFVSDDKDFRSPLGNEEFNSFLMDEWATRKKSKLFYYVQLSGFFLEHHADIKLRVEEEKNQLIDELAQSGNFARTHTLIGKLSQFDGFSETQIKQLIDTALSNSQVYWIAQDADVNSFFKNLIQGKEALLSEEVLNQFRSYFIEEDPQNEPEDIPDEDLPF